MKLSVRLCPDEGTVRGALEELTLELAAKCYEARVLHEQVERLEMRNASLSDERGKLLAKRDRHEKAIMKARRSLCLQRSGPRSIGSTSKRCRGINETPHPATDVHGQTDGV
jgi:hypothetical protein